MLTYTMDVLPESIWLRTTPGASAMGQPYVCTEAGQYLAQGHFSTARTHKESYLLFYTLRGAGLIEQGDDRVLLRAGQALLMDCRKPQRYATAPGQIPEGKEEIASLLDGVSRYWKHQTLAQLKEAVGHIDMMVTGASAITPSGIRFGKGHGYFDLEYAMLSTVGLCDETTAIVGAGHDVQVVDVDVTVEDYDTAIDYIVTPTRLIETRHEYPRPSKGIIWSRLAPGMREQIPPIQELWCKVHCK